MYSNTDLDNSSTLNRREDELLRVSEHLMEILVGQQGLQPIVDYAYGLLGNHPVFVIDTAGTLLAWSSQADYSEPVLQEQLRTGRIDQATHEAFRNDRRLEDLFTRTRPTLYRAEPEGRRGVASLPGGVLIAAVRLGKAIVGYLVALGVGTTFPTGSEDIAAVILRAVTIEMQKSDFTSHTRGSAFEALLNDILEGREGSDEFLRSEFATLGRPLNHDLYAIVFTEQRGAASTFMRASAQGMLRTFFPQATTVAYERNVVMLATLPEGMSLPLDNQELNAYLVTIGAIAGVSGPFVSLADVRKHYRLALEAARLGGRHNSGRRIHTQVQQAVNRLLSQVEQTDDLRSYCIPELLRLWEGGRPTDREMLKCLFCYLRHMKAVSSASEELHIHRNTLIYRVNRIAELVHLDLSDGTTVERVMLTEDVLRYLGRL